MYESGLTGDERCRRPVETPFAGHARSAGLAFTSVLRNPVPVTQGQGTPAGGPVRELDGGVRLPVLGLGVSRLPDGREAEQAVEWALEAGYRHIDTAAVYGNERSVGAALGRSGIAREDVFVTTKFMPAHGGAAGELAGSLERLRLDYVDLYLIHWPRRLRNARLWRELQTLQEQGQTRAVGVSNFGRKQLARLAAGSSRLPAVDQVQFSPFHFRRRLLEHCEAHGIALEAHSPLERGRELGHPVIARIAQRLERTPAQVMLRWAVQHNAIVIPKSGRRERIRSNAQIFDFELGEDDMRTLDGLDRTHGTGRAR